VQLRHDEFWAALDMGTVLRLALRADRRGPVALSSLSECMKGRVQEAEKWLQIVLDRGGVQMSYLAFDTGQEEESLSHLKLYRKCCLEDGRDQCRGCEQVRGEDAQMLTCGGKLSCCAMCAIDDLHLFMTVRMVTCIRCK
jgi:hypothetical protein